MEAATIITILLAIGAYLRWKPTRAECWNWIAAWAAANRDAAITREQRRREYLASEVGNGA